MLDWTSHFCVYGLRYLDITQNNLLSIVFLKILSSKFQNLRDVVCEALKTGYNGDATSKHKLEPQAEARFVARMLLANNATPKRKLEPQAEARLVARMLQANNAVIQKAEQWTKR
ncbi:MAG: hypothetical protein IKX88_10055 [Thermoguttaceae bacterium]|nr:hypothetical protein [Thermoguttaceae bacterium]